MDQSTRMYYGRGAANSRNNAISLWHSAEILHKAKKKNHALFFLCIANEEMEKAVYCDLVSRGFFKPEDIEDIFQYHELKTLLYDKFFNEQMTVEGNQMKFNKMQITRENLKQIHTNKSGQIKEYLEFKNHRLYVDKKNDWTIPDRIPDETAEHWYGELRKTHQALDTLFTALGAVARRDFAELRGFTLDWNYDENGQPLANVSFDIK